MRYIKSWILAFGLSMFSGVTLAAEVDPYSVTPDDGNTHADMPRVDNKLTRNRKEEAEVQLSIDSQLGETNERNATYSMFVGKNQRGSTKPIPNSVILAYCGDFDGCTLRLGMFDWDDKGRVASRSGLFYYNTTNRNWRSSMDWWQHSPPNRAHIDWAGQDANNVTNHVMQAWSCYLTDGEYQNFKAPTDTAVGFGLLSWSQYNAGCRLTITD